MNKKDNKKSVIYDDKEDKNIEKIANSKKNDPTHKILLIILIILFVLTLFISVSYIITYKNDKNNPNNGEIIEIKTKSANISIVNNGFVREKIDDQKFLEEKEYVVENINTIELIPTDDENNKVNYDIKYNIIKNDFKLNNIPSNNSEVLVKFSYSYDKEEWLYVNNVISTTNSNISPLIGNNYDIAGMLTTLNVATNVELATNDKKTSKIYWRSETIFKNLEEVTESKEFNANFNIEYKSN